jgi:hypothetical protein
MAEKVTVTVKTKRTLMLPQLPNHLRDEQGGTVPVESLSQDQLDEVGRKWTDALKQKARDRAALNGATEYV